MSDDQVTLTQEQADLCRAVLSQDLMKVSGLLGKGADGSGNPLDDDNLRELLRYSGRLQLTLMALGMTSSDLEKIVKNLGTPLN